MAITAAQVKELRQRTGCGMMECKKALVEADADMDAAAEALRKSGLAKADKKAGRVAAEGIIVVDISLDGTHITFRVDVHYAPAHHCRLHLPQCRFQGMALTVDITARDIVPVYQGDTPDPGTRQ